MATITLSLADDALPRVRQQAQARGFATPEAYLESLLAEDLRRTDQAHLEAVLAERVESGMAVEMDDADFQRIREAAAARIVAARNKP